MLHLRTICAVAALGFASACGGGETIYESGGSIFRAWNPAGVGDVKGAPIAEFKADIQRQLGRRPAWATEDQWTHVKRLYTGYQHAPLWMDEDGLLEPRADALLDAIVQATEDAILIDHSHLIETAAMLDTLERAERPTAAQWARADMLLTTSYVALAEDLLTGQIDPKTVGQSWYIDPQEEKIDSVITLALRNKNLANAIAQMRPQDPEYTALRERLAEYRKLASNGGWQPIPADGKRDTAWTAAVQARLAAEGIDASDLKRGVAEFQQRHAIVVDSQVGSETLASMNVPAAFRLTQIAANMERHRWLPRALGDKYLVVNVPAFRLEGYEAGEKTIEMKVIVGQEFEGRATPVFSDKMEFVVFRPYWNVTPNIAAKELFPQFAATGMPADYETYTENGELRLRQVPGEKNALGLVKFMFPNDFNIYLHDTPNDDLFEKDIRAFSHGCIRLEKPAELAQWVLGWDAGRVDRMMHGKNNQHVTLRNKIPVYITYMTAYPRDGELWFGNDLYGRDTELASAVAQGAAPTPEAVQAVETLRRFID